MDKQTENYLLQQVETLSRRINSLFVKHEDFYSEWDRFMDYGFDTKLEGSLHDGNISSIIKDIVD